jgi:hypothetical protein
VSKCFNDRNQCFKKEVKNTEIGHLYEHIVLEYISDYIELKINTRPNVSGFTCWDWNDKNEGVFEITINTANFEALSFAISKATSLLERIIKTSVAPKQMTLEATCLVSSVV